MQLKYDLAFWSAYKKAGYRTVIHVGIMGDGNTPGRISRVTTRNVFVQIAGHVEPMHPDDLRPANPNSIGAMKQMGLL